MPFRSPVCPIPCSYSLVSKANLPISCEQACCPPSLPRWQEGVSPSVTVSFWKGPVQASSAVAVLFCSPFHLGACSEVPAPTEMGSSCFLSWGPGSENQACRHLYSPGLVSLVPSFWESASPRERVRMTSMFLLRTRSYQTAPWSLRKSI